MAVVLSDRDAAKIKTELDRHKANIVAHLPDNAYRAQWVGMIERLAARLESDVPTRSTLAVIGTKK